MKETIDNVWVDPKYDICSSELEKLRESEDLVIIIGNAFRYGYALGQRAERKRLNRTANTVKPTM